jgi:hypothetical protein
MGVPGWAVFSALLVGIVARQAAAAPQPQCIGDCDGDRKVAINELVSLVNIALGTGTAAACASGTCDGEVEISCLVRAVNSALDGCPMVTLSPPIVFNGEENRLAAYETEPPFKKQVVIPSESDVPGGKGAISTRRSASRAGRKARCVHRRRGHEPGSGHNTAGWGYFELSGSKVGESTSSSWAN